jgi:hypothetical protein
VAVNGVGIYCTRPLLHPAYSFFDAPSTPVRWYDSWGRSLAMRPSAPRPDREERDALALVGENRLLAVLLAEVLHILATRPSDEALQRARTWVCAREPERRFSFEQACAAFGLDADRVRRRLGLRAQGGRRGSTRTFLRP